MVGIADGNYPVAGLNGICPDDGDFLEGARRLQQGEIVGFITGNQPQLDRRLSAQIACDLA